HHEKIPDESDVVQPLLQAREVVRYTFLNIDVNKGRAGAWKLPNLSNHFRTNRDPDLRGYFSDDFRGAPLVYRTTKTVEVTDADGLDTFVAQLGDQAADESFIQRLQHRAIRGHPFRNVEPKVARHQRLWEFEIEIVKLVAMLPADLDGVAKSGRGKQRRRRPFALDQRVRNQRCPVNQGAALPCFYRAVLQRGSERIFNSYTGVARRRQSLADDSRAVFTDQQQVGKRNADIN